MEPVLGGRDDTVRSAPWSSTSVLPQWSPSLADGTTAHAGSHRRLLGLAAMEPVLGGRDDVQVLNDIGFQGIMPQWSPSLADGTTGLYLEGQPVSPAQPQWSPSLADGTTAQRRIRQLRGGAAAMEPVLGGRDDNARAGPAAAGDTCRNGARPWRTGRRRVRAADHPVALRAAMEPVLGGRDDTSPSGPPSATSWRRNGARPWRTGRPGGRDRGPAGERAAAMEPSLADGTTLS